MSAKEMMDALYVPWYTDKEGHTTRHYLKEVVMALVPTRFVPLEVLETAEKHLYDPLKAAEYVYDVFYIYRETVSGLAEAPHVFNNGVLEWPNPADFSWSDMEYVLTGKKVLPPEPQNVEISVREGKYKKTTELDVHTSQMKTTTKELTEIDRLGESMKYSIPDVQLIASTGMQAWQLTSLRWYANYLGWGADFTKAGQEDKAKKYFEDLPECIQGLKEPKAIPAVYMKKRFGAPFTAEKEMKPDFMALMFWNS